MLGRTYHLGLDRPTTSSTLSTMLETLGVSAASGPVEQEDRTPNRGGGGVRERWDTGPIPGLFSVEDVSCPLLVPSRQHRAVLSCGRFLATSP